MRAAPVPIVQRTGTPIIDRNLDDIQEAFKRLRAGAGQSVSQDLTFNVRGGEGAEPTTQLPRFAITDAIGRATVSGTGTATLLTLAAPYRSGEITLNTDLDLYSIDQRGWKDGQDLHLFVDGLHPEPPSAVFTLKHNPSDAGGGGVYVGECLSTGEGMDATWARPVALWLKRRARLNRWQLMAACGPIGRSHAGILDATLTGSGPTRRISVPPGTKRAKLTPATAETVYGIDPTGFFEGDSLKLVIYGGAFPVTLVNLDGTASQLALYESPTEETIDTTTVLDFLRIDGKWWQEG
jgi:hypothetical protein